MANLFSYSRIVLALFFVYLISIDQLTIGFFILALATITDYLDGFIARKLNQVSDFGKVLDPIADRFLVICVCFSLLLKFSEPLIKFAAIALISRELIVGLGFAWLRTKQIKIEVSKIGKVSTALVFIAFVVTFALPKLGIYLLMLAISLYIISALGYTLTAWRKIDQKN